VTCARQNSCVLITKPTSLSSELFGENWSGKHPPGAPKSASEPCTGGWLWMALLPVRCGGRRTSDSTFCRKVRHSAQNNMRTLSPSRRDSLGHAPHPVLRYIPLHWVVAGVLTGEIFPLLGNLLLALRALRIMFCCDRVSRVVVSCSRLTQLGLRLALARFLSGWVQPIQSIPLRTPKHKFTKNIRLRVSAVVCNWGGVV